MKKAFPLSFEFLYQIFSLIICIILVHAIYVGVIWPASDAFLAEQAALMKEDPSHVAKQSVFVVLRDYEQETEIILMFWALAIMVYKAMLTIRHRSLLQLDLIPLAEGMRILPEDTNDISRQIQALPPDQRRGRFKIDQKASLLQLEVEGKEIDVTSTREVTLILAGKIPVMKTIFDIVREGKIPLITFQSHGRKMSDLDDTERFSIKGNLLDGKILLPIGEPGVDREDFTLDKASGEVVISPGILEGKSQGSVEEPATAGWQTESRLKGSGSSFPS